MRFVSFHGARSSVRIPAPAARACTTQAFPLTANQGHSTSPSESGKVHIHRRHNRRCSALLADCILAILRCDVGMKIVRSVRGMFRRLLHREGTSGSQKLLCTSSRVSTTTCSAPAPRLISMFTNFPIRPSQSSLRLAAKLYQESHCSQPSSSSLAPFSLPHQPNFNPPTQLQMLPR